MNTKPPNDHDTLNELLQESHEPINELLLDAEMVSSELLREAFEPTLVRASAGTGKTYQLTARLLKILLTGASPETVLATTFTRKAAGEILSRVLVTLGQASAPGKNKQLDELRAQVGLPNLPRHVCGDLFHRLLRNIHRLRICTLDSLFSQLARALPFELDLPPAWQLTDDVEEIWLRQLAVGELVDTLKAAETETLISMLGRGDVKRNVARELINVVENTFAFSRQAAPETWDTIKVPTAPESAEITRTSGRFRSAELKQKSLNALLEKMADHLDARDFSPLVEQTLLNNIYAASRNGEDIKYGRSKFPPELHEDLHVLYQAVACEALSLLRSQNQATSSVAEHYETIVTTIKQTRRQLSFDDVSVRLANVLSGLDAATVQGRLDSRIDHLLLDEFQDTSPVQWQVLRRLAESVTGITAIKDVGSLDSHRSQSFFCVGDTKQAIYGWRGGVAEIFDAVDHQIQGVISKQQDESYRSSEIVLDSVTLAFKNLTRHPMVGASSQDPAEKSLYESEAVTKFATQFPTHTAAVSRPGHVLMKTAPAADVHKDQDGKSIKPSAADIQNTLLDHVAEQIKRLHETNPDLTIGVLTRTNDTVSAVIDRLELLDVDVSGEGGNPLTDSVGVRWILSALRMIEYPGDGRWRYHVAHSPLQHALPMGPQNALSDAADFLRIMVDHRGLAPTVLFLVEALIPYCDSRETSRLRQLIDTTTLFGHTARTRLRDFVELIEVKRIQRPRAAAVRVMTIHQSKGLEFDAVFLPELHKDLIGRPPQCVADVPELGKAPTGLSRLVGEKQWHFLPTRWQKAFGKNVASRVTEALCLLYVAMTRARFGLYMTIPPATKPEFNNKTSASLLYHALSGSSDHDPVDPTQSNITLFESGNDDWVKAIATANPKELDSGTPEKIERLQFQPIGKTPHRNFIKTTSKFAFMDSA